MKDKKYGSTEDCSLDGWVDSLPRVHGARDELAILKELASVLEYAANHIPGDIRRGVFVKAYVEGEDWAIEQMSHNESIYDVTNIVPSTIPVS